MDTIDTSIFVLTYCVNYTNVFIFILIYIYARIFLNNYTNIHIFKVTHIYTLCKHIYKNISQKNNFITKYSIYIHN